MNDNTAKIAHIVGQHYACLRGRQFHLWPCGGASVNSSNFFIGLDGRVDKPEFVVKAERVAGTEQHRRRLQTLSVQHQLSLRNSLVPRVLMTADKECAILIDDWLISLTACASGHDSTSQTSRSIEAAQGLALFHRDSKSVRTNILRCRKYGLLTDDELVLVEQQLQITELQSEFVGMVREFLREFVPDCYAKIREIEARQDLPKQLVHCDFHPGNAVFSDDRLVAILDYDSLISDFRMQSVAFACSRFTSTDDYWQFLAAYHQFDCLTADEVRLFPLFVMREAVQRGNWLIHTNFFENQPLWQSEISKHLDWIVQMQELEKAFARLSNSDILGRLEENATPTIASRAKAA